MTKKKDKDADMAILEVAPDAPLEWHNERRKISQLIPYEHNPRQMSEKQVADLTASLTRFNLVEVPAIDVDGIIVAGHQRAKILSLIGRGEEEIDVRVPNRKLTPDEFREYLIRSNHNTGSWDFDTLANTFDMGELKQWGFEDWEFGIEPEKEVAVEDVDAPLELPEVPVSVLGDLWLLGEHRVLCGDSTNADDVDKLLDGRKPFLMVTDPPYGVDYDPQWRHKRGMNKSERVGKVENDDRADWTEAYELFPGDVVYVWHPSLHAIEFGSNLQDCGFIIRSIIIWRKQKFAISQGHYHWRHEPCYYAVRKGSTAKWNGDRTQQTVWDDISANDGTGDSTHGTQKPFECMARPIRNHGGPDDDVYDPFLGSGTTVIAADVLKRRCFGLELKPGYVDVIVERWQALTGKQAMHASGKTFAEMKAERLPQQSEAPVGASSGEPVAT